MRVEGQDGECRVRASDIFFTALMRKIINSKKGFTLVEIMIVVTIISMLAAIAVPGFLRARKRAQAARILEDLRLLDGATDQYAIETNRGTGFNPALADLKLYLKYGSPLYNSGCDIFGNAYGPFTVDSLPLISTAAFNMLSDVAGTSYWGSYKQ